MIKDAIFAATFFLASIASLVAVGWFVIAQPMMRNHAECGHVTLCTKAPHHDG